MPPTRRDLLALAPLLATGCAVPIAAPRPGGPRRFEAVAFDAFPIFDPRSLPARAEALAPGHGRALFASWRQKIFAYSWLRAAGGRYRDFEQCIRDALGAALEELGVTLSASARRELARALFELDPWPDARPVLEALRASGLRLVFLSNFTPRMLDALVSRAGFQDLFEAPLSTDLARSFKPAPAAYALGERHLGLARDQILFVAFAGWDAAGAKWFGYPTFWVNRLAATREHLDATPDGEGAGLDGLLPFVAGRTGATTIGG